MILIIQNLTSDQLSYLSGALTVPANSNTTVPITQIFQASRDSQLIADCTNNVVTLSDGVNLYANGGALDYLNQIAMALGSQVIGYIGASTPSFAILVGAKDPNGSTQFSTVNHFNELSIQYRNQYRNITGNTTTAIKSGSGRLHGIMINNNTSGGTIVVYDNTAGSGTKIGTFQVGSPSGGLLSSSGQPGPIFIGPLGLEFSIGLTIVTSGSNSNDITVLYQ